MTDTIENPAVDADNFIDRYRAYEQRAEALHPVNKAAILAALHAAGVTKVTVIFDGSSDDGQIQEIIATSDGKEIILPNLPVELASIDFHSPDVTRATSPLPHALEIFCYDVLESKHAGWGNNAGAFGEFIFDVTADTVTLDFNYRLDEYESHFHEI